jgi:hypothetical protein
MQTEVIIHIYIFRSSNTIHFGIRDSGPIFRQHMLNVCTYRGQRGTELWISIQRYMTKVWIAGMKLCALNKQST